MRTPEQATLAEAIERWGVAAQLRMLQEECGELIAAVNQFYRGRRGSYEALVEEVADVEILLRQARIMLGADAVDEAVGRKLDRLRKRLGAERAAP